MSLEKSFKLGKIVFAANVLRENVPCSCMSSVQYLIGCFEHVMSLQKIMPYRLLATLMLENFCPRDLKCRIENILL
jgi:hypothetical protein